MLACDFCGESFKSENTMINHRKACGGTRAERDGYRRCEKCGREVSRGDIARHRTTLTVREGDGGAREEVKPERDPPGAAAPVCEEPPLRPLARVYRQKWANCPICLQ